MMQRNPLLVHVVLVFLMAAFICKAARNVIGVSASHILRPAFAVVLNAKQQQHNHQRGSSSRFIPSMSEKIAGESTHDLASVGTTKLQHTVTWITLDDTIEFSAADGTTLRTAALRSGAVSPHNNRANLINCRGLGTCGTCAVSIQFSDCDGVPPPIEPSERNSVENWRLSLPPGHGPSSIGSDLRLACQVRVRGNVKVTKYAGFWGQNIGHLAEKSLPTQPLGKLEFILDKNKSPP